MKERITLAFAALGLTLFGACSDQIPLGMESFYWSANFETGDLTQWMDPEGVPGHPTDGQAVSVDTQLTVVTSPAPHSGKYAFKSAIFAAGNTSFARLFRWGILPQDAYYRVWMYIPQAYTIGQYWSVFEFQGRTDPSNVNSSVQYLWSLDLARRPSDGALTWYLWDSQRSRQINPDVPTAAPIGRWFRIEAFMHKAADSTGKIEFFLDGVSLLKSENVSTVPNDWLYWVVGGASNKITEQPAIVYLDDAAILRDGPGM